MMRTILLFSALAVAMLDLPAQVPGSVARIITTMPQKDGITMGEYENTGSKPITAIVIEKPVTGLDGMTTTMVSADFPGQPLGHNGRGMLQVWNDTPVTEMYVAAVIFEDGTTMGYSRPNPEAPDVVTAIFLRRKGEAEALARWHNFVKSLAGKDDKTAIAEFIKAANAIPAVHDFIGNDTNEARGQNDALMDIQNQARNAEIFLSKGERDARWVREQMLTKYISWRAKEGEKYAKRIPQ
jgi:hypothetical protein